ncbi:hypothetical protein GQ457_08G025480 [Hibiscus cannabinus]
MDGKLLHQEGENRDVRYWSEINQSQNGDSLPVGYISRYAESTCVNVKQNDMGELKQVWESLDREGRQFFFTTYGDIAHLLYVQVGDTMLQALIQFWNLGYRCFTLNGKDLMPTVEEYSELLRIPNVTEGRKTFFPSMHAANWKEDALEDVLRCYSTKWVEAFRNLQEQDLVWRVPWLKCRKFLYKCYDHDWLMLLGLWEAIGCAPLLVSRQLESRQFVPYTAGLADSEFSFDTEFRKRVTNINKNRKYCYWTKTVYDSKGMVTPEYVSWMQTRVNDTIPLPNQGQEVPMENRLRVFPSEADLLRVELADARAEIEKMGEKHIRDLFLKKVEVDEYEGKAVRAMEKYSTLKNDFDLQKEELRRLEASIKHMELRKTPAEWRREIQQAKDRQKHLAKLKIEKEKKMNHNLVQDENKKAQFNQSQDHYAKLEARMKEQEAMIREFQTRDEYAELQASQNKIETLEKEVKDIWALVQTCQISVHVLEDIKVGGNDYWFTRLRDVARRFQEQDKTNEKIMNLARDVAEHVTAIAREARILRPHVVSKEMKSSLEMLFDQINDLGIRVKPYLPRNWKIELISISVKILYYFTRSEARAMNIEERVAKLEQGQQDVKACLDMVKQGISDQIAQSQETTIAQLTALLEKRDGKRKVSEERLNIEE